jgi:hypothetical protein
LVIVLSLLYYLFLDETPLWPAVKRVGAAVLFAGVLAEFWRIPAPPYLRMRGRVSIRTAVSLIGAILMASAAILHEDDKPDSRKRHPNTQAFIWPPSEEDFYG